MILCLEAQADQRGDTREDNDGDDCRREDKSLLFHIHV